MMGTRTIPFAVLPQVTTPNANMPLTAFAGFDQSNGNGITLGDTVTHGTPIVLERTVILSLVRQL